MDTTRDDILEGIRDAVGRVDAAALTVERLADLPGYSWVGIYWVEGADLVLGPWAGPQATEHTRIPMGEGICGAAASSGMTEIVDDVTTDGRYLACFAETRSEIVVPIRATDGTVIGEIDVDGTQVGAFGDDDAKVLEAIAEALGAKTPAG